MSEQRPFGETDQVFLGQVPAKNVVGGIPGAAYAELTLNANASPTTATLENTYYPVAGTWLQDEDHLGMSTAPPANGITCQTSGVFLTICAITVSLTTTDEWQFSILKNGTPIPDHTAVVRVPVPPDYASASLSGIDTLTVGDLLTIQAQNLSASAHSVTASFANFSVMRIG